MKHDDDQELARVVGRGDFTRLGTAGSATGSPWRSIATAPKDGTSVLLFDGATVSYGGWVSAADQGAEYCEEHLIAAGWWSVDLRENAPTHWMPLPEPPQTETIPHHCTPSDYVAMIVRLQRIESGELSSRDVDWRTRAGVLWRMLHYATRPTDASVDAFLATWTVEHPPSDPAVPKRD